MNLMNGGFLYEKNICFVFGIDIDFFFVELKPLEKVLMCSDGLTNMLDDEEIRMIIKGQRDIVEKVEALVKEANNRGGTDNISLHCPARASLLLRLPPK